MQMRSTETHLDTVVAVVATVSPSSSSECASGAPRPAHAREPRILVVAIGRLACAGVLNGGLVIRFVIRYSGDRGTGEKCTGGHAGS